MSDEQAEVFPPVVLRDDERVGIYIYYDDSKAEELRECLAADEVEFSLNPPEAAHLAQPGKAVFVISRGHPRVVAEWLDSIGAEVIIDPDVVIPEDHYLPPVKQLLELGEPHYEQKRDYIALGL